MGQTIYVVNHALSDGIQTVQNAKIYAAGEEGEFAVGKLDTPGYDQEQKWEKKDFFVTEQEAFDAANERRLNYVKSMKDNAEKWENFEFGPDHWKYEAPE